MIRETTTSSSGSGVGMQDTLGKGKTWKQVFSDINVRYYSVRSFSFFFKPLISVRQCGKYPATPKYPVLRPEKQRPRVDGLPCPRNEKKTRILKLTGK